MKVDSFLGWHVRVDVFLEVLIRHLVAILELTIVVALLLNGIISQVDEPVPKIFEVELNT